MPERVYKLQPDRTIALRGFDSFAAAAAVHSATPNGFQVAGTFRDPADFAVVVLYDADNFFEHPSIKYLPDFNFSGLTLSFDVECSDGVQPIDSPKYNWIDWATLDFVLADGSRPRLRLWDNAMLASGAFTPASSTLSLSSSGVVQPGDHVSLWYLNLAFDYTVPVDKQLAAEFSFFTGTPGTTHSIMINGRVWTAIESEGESSGAVAEALILAINAGDPECTALTGTASNSVLLNVKSGSEGKAIPVSATDGNAPVVLFKSIPSLVAAEIASQINATDWIAANSVHALMATTSDSQIVLSAARYGEVSVSGTTVVLASGAVFGGLSAGDPIRIAGTLYTVASVQSPTALTLSSPAPNAVMASYVAPRGGRDGNMIRLYTLSKTSTLAFDQPVTQLTGGTSAVTWTCRLDFSAAHVDQIRQAWLTFAPSLADSAAYSATEWQANFSNWSLTGPEDTKKLQIAGPGSVRIEETDTACRYTGTWTTDDTTSAKYSRYFAQATNDPSASLTIEWTCQFEHDLYVGTSLYGYLDAGGALLSDRAVVNVSIDGIVQTPVDCRLNTGSALITRRVVASGIAAGTHTVTFTIPGGGHFYFDFLEAAVRSDFPDALPSRTNISPALDFDTDHTYKLPPARLMWIMDKLGYGGPMNEYLGVFWWNERKPVGMTYSTAVLTFAGGFAAGDDVILTLNGTDIGKSVFPNDTLLTIASHFAFYINETFVGTWASASAPGTLTITGRSPANAYTVSVVVKRVNSAAGIVTVASVPVAGTYGPECWVIDDTVNPPLNRATRDWHSDFYSECAARHREVVTACSMELVYPPDGYVACYPDGTAVSTATGFGALTSNHCAIGSTKMLAYQKSVYRNIAQLQAAAGLLPCVQYGEFLWWFNAGTSGMAFYDSDTATAALAALGAPLHRFLTPNDDPALNASAALFLRNRLRDHVASLVADLKSVYPLAQVEVLWPYDVNYPRALPLSGSTLGGQLNRFINLPVEWQHTSTSGLDRIKVEALAFATGMRNLDLAKEAIELFPNFGWNRDLVRYLVPIFGQAIPWTRELALVWGAGLSVANLWAFDHICLYNLEVPERALARRSFINLL